jgi:hypothetical protein
LEAGHCDALGVQFQTRYAQLTFQTRSAQVSFQGFLKALNVVLDEVRELEELMFPESDRLGLSGPIAFHQVIVNLSVVREKGEERKMCQTDDFNVLERSILQRRHDSQDAPTLSFGPPADHTS